MLNNYNPGHRPNATILVQPCEKIYTHACYEQDFEIDSELARIIRLRHLMTSGGPMDEDEIRRVNEETPQLYPQVTADRLGTPLWNGRLLFSVFGKEEARRTVMRHARQWNVVLAYADPDRDFYHFLMETHVEPHTAETFCHTRNQTRKMLYRYLDNPIHHAIDFHLPSVPIECYDVLDRDALFGKLINHENSESCAESHPGSNSWKSWIASTLSSVKTSVSHWFAF